MNEPLGYNLFNANGSLWYSNNGEWSSSYFDARCFETLDGANRKMEYFDTPTDAGVYFVFAVMQTP